MHLKEGLILHNCGGAVDESLDWSRLPLDFYKKYDIIIIYDKEKGKRRE